MAELITVVITTSPIPSHPSTAIIEETIASVRHHLPSVPIIIAADGIRPEQKAIEESYDYYIWKLAEKFGIRDYDMRIEASLGGEFRHQVGMMRQAIGEVRSPLLLFMEHDTPLVIDCSIPWHDIGKAILSGDVNLVRFLHEAKILPEHEYLIRGELESFGVPLTKTTQFSARPHLASVGFYLQLLERFSPEAKSFIEDWAHSFCQTDAWEDWKMAIYTPEGNQKRSYHLDGRGGTEKFSDKQVF